MPVALSDGLQIVPGYRLEIRLGKGGFGEVWRATGPGKVPVALKIIEVKGSAAGDREFRSLDLVRELRHPNLLPVQAYWKLDDDGQVIDDDRPPTTIVIAMLLGGKNLRQRLQECRAVGLAGIPPRELLEMMRDVAKGVDYLNKPIHQHGDHLVAIQHRDIKPENLMIVGGGVMVADFGIAGVMESDRAHTTNSAMTFTYAAPELFDHTATAWTDQYALAITYSELRCGALPFSPGSKMTQIIRIHMEGLHDFSKQSAREREVLQRATSKVPEARYPTCQVFVTELDAAVKAEGLLDDGELYAMTTIDRIVLPQQLGTHIIKVDGTDLKTGSQSSTPTKPPSDVRASSDSMAGSRPSTHPANEPHRSRTLLIVGSAVAVLAMIGFVAWTQRPDPRDATPPGTASGNKSTANATNSNNTGSQDSSSRTTPSAKWNDARLKAAEAARDKKFADVVKTLEPLFEQAVATSDDYVMRGNSYFALADAGESPAENYARAAADFDRAELPREQLRVLTRQGRWLVDHNFAKQAIAPLRQALALKKSPDVQLTLSQALLATGDTKAARDEAIIALTELPPDADSATQARLHYVVARACVALAKQAEADPDMSKQLEQFDLEGVKYFGEAIALATRNKLEEQTTFEEELSRFQKQPRMVDREERRQRTEKIAALTRVLEQSPNVAAKWIELAKLEILDGQTKSSAAHFARGFSLQSLELARAGKFDDAIAAEQKATESDADVVQVQHARALIAFGQGRDKESLAMLGTVLSRTPTKSTDRWQVLSDRGDVYSRLAASMSGTRQDWEKARADFEAAIPLLSAQVTPSENASASAAAQSLARLHHGRAITLEALAMSEVAKPDLALLQQAEKSLLTAISLNPKEPRFALSAGHNLLRQARSAAPGLAELLDRAVPLLTTATTLDDKIAEAHFALGDCQLLRGKSVEARSAFDKAVALANNEPVERQVQYLVNQSAAYLRAPSNDAKALAAAERAIALQRSSAAAHFARGSALRNLKRTEDAIGAFNDTLAAQPKHTGALIARSQLIIGLKDATPKQLTDAHQDIETALAAASTNELKAEAYYVRSLSSLKSAIAQPTTAESALLKAQRDLLQAVKLMPTNKEYLGEATRLFAHAAKFDWKDAQRKVESEALQRELDAILRK